MNLRTYTIVVRSPRRSTLWRKWIWECIPPSVAVQSLAWMNIRTTTTIRRQRYQLNRRLWGPQNGRDVLEKRSPAAAGNQTAAVRSLSLEPGHSTEWAVPAVLVVCVCARVCVRDEKHRAGCLHIRRLWGPIQPPIQLVLVEKRPGREINHYLHLLPRLRMGGAIPVRPLYAFMASIVTTVLEHRSILSCDMDIVCMFDMIFCT
jgi:hypothetical protein